MAIVNAVSKLYGNVKIVDRINASSSDGQLEKWIALSGNELLYFKGCTVSYDNELLYECESECIASRIAELLGIENVVKYDMDELIIGSSVNKVCVSHDFIRDGVFTTYAEAIRDIAKYQGIEKYNMVVDYDRHLQSSINKILLFDMIIGNDDRHLNNLAIIDDGILRYIPLFDNGSSMNSKMPNKAIRNANRISFAMHKCKPFYNTVGEQIKLIDSCELYSVSIEEMKKIVLQFLDKKRANIVLEYLCDNLQEVGNYYGKTLLH